jgi:uracil-DNA glycosylase family 4
METATRSLAPAAAPSLRGVTALVADIRAGVAACRVCPALAPYRKHPPESFGTTRTGYVLVGEAGSRSPRPFDDPAGRTLREALRAVEDPAYRDLEDLFFLTQAVRCAPQRKGGKGSRAPTRGECKACRPYLHFELRALHPRLVVAVGSLAAEAALGEPVRIVEAHGRRWRRGDLEVLTLATPSPRNGAALKRLDITLDGYRRWLTGLFGALVDDLGR